MNQKAFHNFCLRADIVSVEIRQIRAIRVLRRDKSELRASKHMVWMITLNLIIVIVYMSLCGHHCKEDSGRKVKDDRSL